jgi:L-threonylcarbamoyladenylate synthase
MRPILDGSDPRAVRRRRLLAAGELVAFPTETVYGLGARADDDAAWPRIFEAKGRPADHPLIVHVADAAQARQFAAPGDLASWPQRLAAAFWPGPLTVIVPRRAGVACVAAGGQASIGLRCPAHPVAQALLRECARRAWPAWPRRAPTASAASAPPPPHTWPTSSATLLVLDGGACEVGIESAIVDCTRGQPGAAAPFPPPRGTRARGGGRPTCLNLEPQ